MAAYPSLIFAVVVVEVEQQAPLHNFLRIQLQQHMQGEVQVQCQRLPPPPRHHPSLAYNHFIRSLGRMQQGFLEAWAHQHYHLLAVVVVAAVAVADPSSWWLRLQGGLQ